MAEGKLRLAVPDWKWLVHPGRWSVRDILEKAGIGKYSIDESAGKANFTVSSNFPWLEAEVVKPRVIPSEIASGNFDFGITARDCFDNSSPEDIHALDELMDLDCGYVDLAFMTDQKRWTEVQERRAEIEKKLNVGGLSDLDLFLGHYRISGRKLVCGSEYRNLADNLLLSKRTGRPQELDLQYIVKETMRNTEACLSYRGEHGADLIFETVATGEHSSKLKVLEMPQNSTARIYSQSYLRIPKNQDNQWKKDQIRKVEGAIGKVLRSVEELWQIRFIVDLEGKKELFDNFYHFLFTHDQKRHTRGFSGSSDLKMCLDQNVRLVDLPDYLELPPESALRRTLGWLRYPYDIRRGSRGVRSERYAVYENDIEEVASTLLKQALKKSPEPKEKFDQAFNWFGINVEEISFYRLKALYAYCPVLNDREDDEGEADYPCCDVSKLRPEHREQACIHKSRFD